MKMFDDGVTNYHIGPHWDHNGSHRDSIKTTLDIIEAIYGSLHWSKYE